VSRGAGRDGGGRIPSVILFDGVCNLCNTFVQFVIARDPDGRFHFASLQSDSGRRMLRSTALAEPFPDTVVLVESGRAFVRSTAALRIVRRLRAPWPLAYAFIVVPRPLRDWLYDVVARHRYRWFGRRESCIVPTGELRARFISD
jgi:predicted DCC family thiol-disulfide oxidoreductase YuxK